MLAPAASTPGMYQSLFPQLRAAFSGGCTRGPRPSWQAPQRATQPLPGAKQSDPGEGGGITYTPGGIAQQTPRPIVLHCLTLYACMCMYSLEPRAHLLACVPIWAHVCSCCVVHTHVVPTTGGSHHHSPMLSPARLRSVRIKHKLRSLHLRPPDDKPARGEEGVRLSNFVCKFYLPMVCSCHVWFGFCLRRVVFGQGVVTLGRINVKVW